MSMSSAITAGRSRTISVHAVCVAVVVVGVVCACFVRSVGRAHGHVGGNQSVFRGQGFGGGVGRAERASDKRA